MTASLARRWFAETWTHGALSVDGVFECFVLERGLFVSDHPAILDGSYRIVVTPSPRVLADRAAGKGDLGFWSPREDGGLPLLLDVPGRDGIRMHAANRADQLLGCLAPGASRAEDGTVSGSRRALVAWMVKVDAAARLGDDVWLSIETAR